MKRKNLIAKRKVEKKQFFIKDEKTNEFYKKFKKIIFDNHLNMLWLHLDKVV